MSVRNLVCTSVGKKQIVGLSGLALSGFVLMHMAGNMLILVGPEAYNKYSHALVSNPLLPAVELVLLAVFLFHVWFAFSLARDNRRARPVTPYQLPRPGSADRADFGSRTMIYTGLLTFVFVVLHLWTFKYGTHYSATYGGVEMRDLHKLVLEKFGEPLYAGYYIFSMVVLFAHLSHGFGAVFQSLGFASVRNPRLRKLSWAFAAVVAAGFVSQPLYVMLRGGH